MVSGLPAAAIEPVPESCVSTVEERTMEDREKWCKMGLKAISEGKLGVLLLSGGQVVISLCLLPFSLQINIITAIFLKIYYIIIKK